MPPRSQSPSTPAEAALLARIARHGPVGFDELMEVALYDPSVGFFATGPGAGRRGHFITSPEVGPLFGAVLARALDTWWDAMGRPDPYTVVEAGAGRGALAIAVRAAKPRCGSALTYVLVERSAALRAEQARHLPLSLPHLALPPSPGSEEGEVRPGDPRDTPSGPRFTSLAELPPGPVTGVLIANELLDNLPFRMFVRERGSWSEVLVAATTQGGLDEVVVPGGRAECELLDRRAPDAPEGAVVPFQEAAVAWLQAGLGLVSHGRVVVVDYVSSTPEVALRPRDAWLRTYRGHERGGSPLDRLGEQDVTADVCVDQLDRVARPSSYTTQAEFLAAHGIAQLVEEGRTAWLERAHLGDLEAIRGRSRVREAEALTDPSGLGGFGVLEWVRPPGRT